MTGLYNRSTSSFPVAATTGCAAPVVVERLRGEPRRGAVGRARSRCARAVRAAAGRSDAPRGAGALSSAASLERAGHRPRCFGPPGRMVLRNIERQPIRTLTSIVGIAFAVVDARRSASFFARLDRRSSCDVQFTSRSAAGRDRRVRRARSPARALRAASASPGVLAVEADRGCVAVRLRAGHRSRQIGHHRRDPPIARLQRVVDAAARCRSRCRRSGLVLSRSLAEILGVGAGAIVDVDVLEGSRPRRDRAGRGPRGRVSWACRRTWTSRPCTR